MSHRELCEYFIVFKIVLCGVGPLVGVDAKELVVDLRRYFVFTIFLVGEEGEVMCATLVIGHGGQ